MKRKVMEESIINNKKSIGSKYKILIYISISMLALILSFIVNIIFKLDKSISYVEFSLIFIKSFNFILSILALGSCLI